MGDHVTCQDTSFDHSDLACGVRVSRYRACGRGCKHIIAYCKDHGGDERAAVEMQVHHDEEHQVTVSP